MDDKNTAIDLKEKVMDEKENLRVQKAEYIRQQLEKQRQAEDALLEQMMQEQSVIDELQKSMDDSMERTAESRKYNQEFQEKMNAQVYAMHGLSVDKLQGMKEYKRAFYKGCAASLFLLSLVLVIFCGVLHGFQSEICIFMLAYTAIEGTLLASGTRRMKVLSALCGFLYLLMFPIMLVMFVCFELQYPEYEMFLPYIIVAGICFAVLGAASYFLSDPYRREKRNIRRAKEQIKEVEKIAKKEVRKNKRIQEKEDTARAKRMRKEEAAEEKRLQKERAAEEKRLRKELAVQEKRMRQEEAGRVKGLLPRAKGGNWLLEKRDGISGYFRREKRDSVFAGTMEEANVLEAVEVAEEANVSEAVEATEEALPAKVEKTDNNILEDR